MINLNKIDSLENDDIELLISLLTEAHIYPMENKFISDKCETSDEVLEIQEKLRFMIQEFSNIIS